MEPSTWGPPRLYIARGNSLDDRVRLIFAMQTFSILDPLAVRAAAQMAAPCGEDEDCIINTVFDVHRELMPYGLEHEGIDLFRAWRYSVADASADCDCMVIANNAILTIRGFVTGLTVVHQNGPQDHVWSLVWLPRGTPSRVMPLDMSVAGSRPGWEEPSRYYTSRRNYVYDATVWVPWCVREFGGGRPSAASVRDPDSILRTAPQAKRA